MPVNLESFSFQHCGPFSNLTTLELGQPLTILTGKNDVGKSSILKFIEASLNKETIDPSDVNRRRSIDGGVLPNEDSTVFCKLIYQDTTNNRYEATYQLSTPLNSWRLPGNYVAPAVPSCINLTDCQEIRSEFPLLDANTTEHNLLSLGLATNFNASTFVKLAEARQHSAMRDVEMALNDRLKELLPNTEYSFRAMLLSENNVGIEIVDSRGATGIAKRGDGARKIFQLLANLLLVAPTTKSPVVVLIDEAETSLHADAQRRLRDFLFKLATTPNLSIIYSTHSPVMVSQLYPECVRVVLPGKGLLSPVIKTKSFGSNMALVRRELGMQPADSLLFADTTLVVEGPSEYLTILKILQFIPEMFDGEIYPEDVTKVINAVCVHNGEGDNIKAICNLILSQGANPVVLLDGDKNKVVLPEGAAKTILPVGLEIEDVISIEKYMAGVKKACELLDSPEILAEQYEKWRSEKDVADQHFKKLLTSKRVERWLSEEYDRSLKKPMAFLNAIDNCEAHDILHKESFRTLFQQLKESLPL